eukprot:10496917-Ditylum_brightwellii.AAC.1
MKSKPPPQQNSTGDNNSKDKYEEINKCMEANNKKHTEALNQIQDGLAPVSYTHLRAHETLRHL